MTKCKYFLTSTLFVLLVSLSVSLSAVKPKNSTQAKTSASKASPAPGSAHPISDPEEFGLSLLFKKKTPKDIEQSIKKLKGKESDSHFLRNQAASCDSKAMYLLGQLEEKEGNIDSAFSWYVIAFCVECLTYPDGVKKNEELKKKLQSTPHEEQKRFIELFLNYFNERKEFEKIRFLLAASLHEGFTKSLFYEKKLSSFMVEIANFNEQKNSLKPDDLKGLQENMLRLSELFYKRNDWDGYAYCLRLSQTDRALSKYMQLINDKKICVDLDGRLFSEEKTHQILGSIFLKIKEPSLDQNYFIGLYIMADHIKKINEKTIKNKHIAASEYFRKAKDQNSLYQIACLIETQKINEDENGRKIKLEEKHDVAARLFKEIKPESFYYKNALVKLACLYYDGSVKFDGDEQAKLEKIVALLKDSFDLSESKGLFARMILFDSIKKDQNNQEIKEEDRIKVAADILCEARNIEDFYLLGSLILCRDLDPIYGLKMLNIQDDGLGKHQIAAKLYRQSGVPDALYNLGVLILHNCVDEDDGQKITSENRIEKARELFECSGTAESMFDLGIIEFDTCKDLYLEIFSKPMSMANFLSKAEEFYKKENFKKENLNQLLEYAKKSLDYFQKAIMLGHNKAYFHFDLLNEIIKFLEQMMNESKGYGNPNQVDLSTNDSDSSEEISTLEIVSMNPPEMDSILRNNIVARNPQILIDDLNSSEIKKDKKRNKAISALFSKDKVVKLKKLEGKKLDTTKKYKIQWSKKSEKDLNKLDRKYHKKIWGFIDDIQQMGLDKGEGKPEKLLGIADSYSRRINAKDRFVYKVVDLDTLEIVSCLEHY